MLEITRNPSECFERLAVIIQKTLKELTLNSIINIVSPRTSFVKKNFQNLGLNLALIHFNNDIQGYNPMHTIYFFDEFDFIDNLAIIPNGNYITSLRFARTSLHITNWINGKINDNLLALIALKRGISAFNPSTSTFEIITDLDCPVGPSEAYSVSYPGYSGISKKKSGGRPKFSLPIFAQHQKMKKFKNGTFATQEIVDADFFEEIEENKNNE